MARIHFVTDQGRQAIELQPHQGIGRHPNNAIQLLDTIVSKEHIVIERQGPSMVLRDLGSMNGTFIGASKITRRTTLRGGDTLQKFALTNGDEPAFVFSPDPPEALTGLPEPKSSDEEERERGRKKRAPRRN